MEQDETYEGRSDASFADAAEKAVGQFEKENGVPDEPVRFRVVNMYVEAQHNPIHVYIVVLGIEP